MPEAERSPVLLKDCHPKDPLSHQMVGQLGQVGLNRVGDTRTGKFSHSRLRCLPVSIQVAEAGQLRNGPEHFDPIEPLATQVK
jgi:hypothetical protein